MPARLIYPIMLTLAVIAFLLLPASFYHFPDETYLFARYAQNLTARDGIGFNPHERILLTPAILPILGQALEAVPVENFDHPMRLMSLLLLSSGLAALIRVLNPLPMYGEGEGGGVSFAIGVAIVWVIGSWSALGGSGWWLACLYLIATDLAHSQRISLAGFVAGLAMLVSPFAIIFALLTGLKMPRRYWIGVIFPAMCWLFFAFFYFGPHGLRGLTLYPTGNDFLPYMIILGAIFLLNYPLSLPQGWLPLIIFGLAYTLITVLLDMQTNVALLWLVLLMVGFFGLTQQRSAQHWRYALKGALLLIILITLSTWINQSTYSSTYPQIQGSKGYYGNYQDAFYLRGAIYGLSGATNPHLRDLMNSGDQVGVLLATAPDILLLDSLPEDRALDLLSYTQQNGYWQRETPVGRWQPIQPVNFTFGTDIHLRQIAVDRDQILSGDMLRVRLDWQLDKVPEMPIYLTLNLLDFQGVDFGGIEQVFPVEKWSKLETTTYHVLPVNADAPPGLYYVEVVVGYNAAIVDRQRVTTIKSPVVSNVLDAPPLVSFNGIDLMAAEVEQVDQQIILDLTWQAAGTLSADYTVFVHLTAPDDVTPLAQIDAPPMGGRYPTSIWSPGEVITERYNLDVSPVPAGEYVIRVGWYNPQLGRLPTPEGDVFIVRNITLTE